MLFRAISGFASSAAGSSVAAALVLRVLLEVCYRDFIVPHYSYLGFVYNPLELEVALFSYAASLTPLLWMPATHRRPSDILSLLIYLLVIIPTAFVPFAAGVASDANMMAFVLACLGAHAVLSQLPDRLSVLVPVSVAGRMQWPWLLILVIAAIVVVVAAFGVPDRVPTLADVYVTRAEFRSESSGLLGRLAVYTMFWTSNVLVPLLIVSGIVRRRRLIVGVGIAIAIFLFATTGMKTVAVMPFAVALVYVLLGFQALRTRRAAILGTSAVIVMAMLGDRLADGFLLTGLGVRRILVVPGLLSGYYVDFFSANETYKLSHSFASAIQPRMYSESPPFLIGGSYFGNANVSANAHALGDAYANFGIAGVLVFGLLLGAAGILLNGAFERIPLRASAAVSLGVLFALTNSAFFTVMLSHGFLLLVFLASAIKWYPDLSSQSVQKRRA